MVEKNKKLFCFGYGYSCAHLASYLLNEGKYAVAGTTRDPEKLQKMRKKGIKAFIFDIEKPLPDPLYILKDATHILISTPPSDEGDPAFIAHAADILDISPGPEWIGYLSTTSVYGDRDGAWVDETSKVNPTSKRGSRRTKAESQWMRLYEKHNLPVHIFRLAGIYGPERSALDSVRAGTARRINKPGHAFSRIHVDDIIQVLVASMKKPSPGSVYNVCDDLAAPSHEVISFACELLDIEPPPLVPFEEADMAPMARSFYKESKRVSNQKIKDELGIDLIYPDYLTGLPACLAEEQYIMTVNGK